MPTAGSVTLPASGSSLSIVRRIAPPVHTPTRHVLLALTALWATAPLPAAAQSLPTEIVVTATRYPAPSMDLAANTARVGANRIALLNASHIHELGTQVPGTWISRGSGQEHLTAIRSPVLTGPGSCGSFLILEDGVAIRPTGFCNVNDLFELPSEQADAIEVIRGPGSALYGSNAVHGTINVLLPEPGDRDLELSGETGPDRFVRGKLLVNSPGNADHTGLVGGLLVDHDGGFRDDSGYRQAKGFVKHASALAAGRLDLGISASVLDQDTAGFILGEDAYKNEALRRSNPNEGSYRDANSQRLHVRWQPAANTADNGWDIHGFLRRSNMEFLQHFLPGEPVEKNGQASGGLTVLRHAMLGSARVTAGLDLEIANGWLEEFQANPETGTPPRPTGQHYDYDAWQWLASPYAQAELPLTPRITLVGGLRLEWLRYDYDNRMLDGNDRDDGAPCTPACLFIRPADRSDSFSNLAPNIGLLYRPGDHSALYATLTRGFRAPQAAELYRLQAVQDMADLNSEAIDSLEIGWRWQSPHLQIATAAFAMRKDDYVLQDSNRFNVSNGESAHVGVEVGIEARTESGFYGSLAATWAKQTYEFNQTVTGGDTITDGHDIDTAPRTLGSLRVGWERDPWLAEAEWVHQGRYYLTAQEAEDYPGHDLLNLRAAWSFSRAWTATVRVNNVTDTLYADRADFAFGNYRYFPGRDREAFVELAWRSP
ncbi:MAG: TonB-dependent receptor [Chromatiales bacterium]|nr:MAG: TonB-dependent receptor [Chromatiales bacterium]